MLPAQKPKCRLKVRTKRELVQPCFLPDLCLLSSAAREIQVNCFSFRRVSWENRSRKSRSFESQRLVWKKPYVTLEFDSVEAIHYLTNVSFILRSSFLGRLSYDD